jgi:hypothetical protein
MKKVKIKKKKTIFKYYKFLLDYKNKYNLNYYSI